jgi:hypothetical protein
MTLSDLSSLASVISGLAVLASLLYLNVQIRHNTAAFQRAEANATQSQASIFRIALINSRDVAQLLAEGRRDDSVLDEADEIRFRATVAEQFWMFRQMWDREKRGLLEKGVWESNSPVLVRILATKRGASWWTTNKSTAPRDLMRDIDDRISAQQATIAKA